MIGQELVSSTPTTCLHCGIPLDASTVQRGTSFCCRGCETIYTTIQAFGLTDFYSFRKALDVKANARTDLKALRFLHLDSEELQRRFVQKEGSRARAVLTLEGIQCAACVWLIEKLPGLLDGVERASLHFGTGQLTIEYDPSAVLLSKIAETLHHLGYTPHVPAQDSEGSARTKGDREALLRLGVAGVSSMNAMMLAVSLWQGMVTGIEEQYASLFRWGSLIVTLPAVLYSAVPFYKTSLNAIRHKILHIDVPIALAIIAAFIMSAVNTAMEREDVYFDAVATLIFLLLSGRYAQRRALQRARARSRMAWSVIPTSATRLRDGVHEEVLVHELHDGDLVEVKAGERFPVDGVVASGSSLVDEAVLTGESLPVVVSMGSEVKAGTMNLDTAIQVKVESVGSASRIGKILQLIETTNGDRSEIVRMADKISGHFVLVVLIGTLITFTAWAQVSWEEAFDNSLALLIVTCPCALGLATPAVLSVALGKAARGGILIKGADTIERLVKGQRVFLDKTGTVTSGDIKVDSVISLSSECDRGRMIAATLSASTPHHPIARAVAAWSRVKGGSLESLSHVAGRGVQGLDEEGRIWRLGSQRWCEEMGVVLPIEVSLAVKEHEMKGNTSSLLCRDSVPVLVFLLVDGIREGAGELVRALHESGRRCALLSGDREAVVQSVGAAIGLRAEDILAERYPEDKREVLVGSDALTVMVGDGVNDALAMRSAFVAVGMRGGLEATMEVADVFVLEPTMRNLELVFRGADRTMRVIKMTLAFSLFYNIVGGLLSVAGYMNPIVAAFLMPISSLTVISFAMFSRTFDLRRSSWR